jgi:hypothetical protein
MISDVSPTRCDQDATLGAQADWHLRRTKRALFRTLFLLNFFFLNLSPVLLIPTNKGV